MLLTSNSDLRPDGIYNWTLPAWVVTLDDGRTVNACPSAGACHKVCYARNGTYKFPDVEAAHKRNLTRVLDDLDGWTVEMLTELEHPRYDPREWPRLPGLDRAHLSDHVTDLLDAGAAIVRVHDAGDHFSDDYLRRWLTIARLVPRVLFYSYTKEVTRFRRIAEAEAPDNFLWCFSMGGKEDHLVDRDVDQHADVFPDEAAIAAAGYFSQHGNDLLCVVAPTNRVGIPANNIASFRRKQGDRTFAELEAANVRHGRPTLPLAPALP